MDVNTKEEMEKCKDPVYFYENYFFINGQKVPPLSDDEKELLRSLVANKHGGTELFSGRKINRVKTFATIHKLALLLSSGQSVFLTARADSIEWYVATLKERYGVCATYTPQYRYPTIDGIAVMDEDKKRLIGYLLELVK